MRSRPYLYISQVRICYIVKTRPEHFFDASHCVLTGTNLLIYLQGDCMLNSWIVVLASCFTLAAAANDCADKIAFHVDEPVYFGSRSLWTDLRILAKSAELVSPESDDILQVGICTKNLTELDYPSEALTATAPAILAKQGG